MRFVSLISFACFGFLQAADAPASFHVDGTGKGPTMILIPGLASSGRVWDSTVARYSGRYECHVLTLAGFAGQPAIDGPFLETVRNDLAKYIRDKKLDKPIVMGHSLGGFLTLWLASKEPDLVGPLIIVDSLPFMGAIMDPKATPETAKPMAEMMKKQIDGPPGEESDKAVAAQIHSMVTGDADFNTIMGWSKASDRNAVGEGMYELMTTDLRTDIASIKSPTLVLGTWIGYKAYTTRETVEKNVRAQYAALPGAQIQIMDTAKHFIMYDDPKGFFQAVDAFLKSRRL